MKNYIRFSRSTIRNIVMFFICVSFIFVNPLYAQNNPEEIRENLRSVLKLQLEMLNKVGPNGEHKDTIINALELLDNLTLEELEVFESVGSSLSDLKSKLEIANDAIYPQIEKINYTSSQQIQGNSLAALSAPLTDANYEECPDGVHGGSSRTPLALRIALQGILQAAEAVRLEFLVACNTVVVGLGAGGNPQNIGCFISEAAWVVEKFFLEAIVLCENSTDSAEIEGSYERAEDIFDNLNEHDSNLATHDVNIDTDLTNHDADIKQKLSELEERFDRVDAQLEVAIKLLKTPPGLREDWNEKN